MQGFAAGIHPGPTPDNKNVIHWPVFRLGANTMHRSVRPLAWLGLLLFLAPAHAADATFFFKDGDRVIMIGDSITEQYLYSSYVEMWTSTRFPSWDITFRNVGIGGDRSVGGNSRFKRDVLANKPTAMTVDFGMNDGGYKPFDEPGFK